ncbi:MAG: AsmA-like C-terminal region-containing protein [Actinomycetota bacterium]
MPVLAWRLSSGPVKLDFLTPYIEDALTARDGSYTVRLDTTVLALADGRMLELRARDVRLYAQGTEPIASVPEMALSINGRALLQGVLAPNRIRLNRPELTLVRDPSGRLQWGMGSQSAEMALEEVLGQIEDALMGAPDPSRPGRHLQLFAIEDARLTVDDQALGVRWEAPRVGIAVRRVPQGLKADGKAEIDLAGDRGSVELSALWRRADQAVDGELKVRDIRLASLARLGGAMAPLAALDLPLSGTVRAGYVAGSGLTGLTFDLSGGAGRVVLAAPLAVDQRISQASLRGRITEGMKRLDLDELWFDLGGPTASLSAVVDGLGGPATVKADAVVREVPIDQLPELWPKGLADNARDWVTTNLSKGIVHEARATLSAHSDSGNFDDVAIDHIGGEIHPEGVLVEYLRPMPPVAKVDGVCTFDASTFRIGVKSGEVTGLKVRDGTIILSGLDKDDQSADIELVVTGPTADALRLIDHKPLQYARALGIEPGQVGGESTTKVRFKFPLSHDLRLDQVGINAHASLKNASIPKVLMGLDMTGGTLELDVDGKGMDAVGPVVLGTIPAELKWHENFGSKGVAFRSRYQLQAPAVDEDQRRSLGLEGPPFVSPFLAGPVAAAVVATFQDGGKAELEARVDLAGAAMSLPGLGWTKEPGKPGVAEVAVRLDKRKLAAVPRFVVTAGDLTTRGAVSFNSDGSAKRVDFQKLAYGRTDGEGSLTFRPAEPGFDIAFRGASFDAQPAVKGSKGADRPKDKAAKDELPPMSVAISARTLWLSDKGSLAGATVNLQRNAEVWRALTLKGTLSSGKTLTAVMQPGGPQKRSFTVVSEDAGGVLRAFDFYDDLTGGKLEITGAFDDAKETQPAVGTARISDYHIRNAPALARLLTVAALAGVVDLLQGEGVSFSSLEAPFTLTDGLLEVRDARAYGPALGLTARGQLDTDRSVLALEGTVVPAYVLNSVLGNIPVLGWLVTGGEKGGGILAFNYSMKGPSAAPDVMVNPLSVLTPGFLRKMFNIFDTGNETDARKQKGGE